MGWTWLKNSSNIDILKDFNRFGIRIKVFLRFWKVNAKLHQAGHQSVFPLFKTNDEVYRPKFRKKTPKI